MANLVANLLSWIPSHTAGLVPPLLDKIEELVEEYGESPSLKLRLNVATMSTVALLSFSLIDESYQVTAILLKSPFVAFKVTVANFLGFSGAIPDTLGPMDWMGHAQRIMQLALAIVIAIVGAPIEAISPGFILSICRKIGITTAELPNPSAQAAARQAVQDQQRTGTVTATSGSSFM